MTRAKLTTAMLRKLWRRPRLAPEFLQEVADWLLQADWVFFYAGPTYAAVRVSAVANWPRVSTNSITTELTQVAEGQYDFDSLEPLLWKASDDVNNKAGAADETESEDDQ